ncbi:MAG: DUF4339 domain-containing protein [Phycisphaerae bacterium]|nr:DUF4339 domain-containing protein [Phycisphaerae bacterium]
MTSWYLLETTSTGEQPAGPFDIQQMAELAWSGRLTRTTRVARAGAAEWTAAELDEDLARLFDGSSTAVETARAPGAPPMHASVGVAMTSRPYSIAAAFELGWRAMTANWGKLVVCTLIFLGGVVVINAPGWLAQIMMIGVTQSDAGGQAAFGAGFIGLSCCGWVLQIFVGVPLFAGFYYCGVRAVRGELQHMDALAGFRRYWAVLGVYLLSALASLGIGIVCMIPFFIGLAISLSTEHPAAAIIAGLVSAVVLIAVMCIMIVWLTMPTLLVVDPKMRAQCCPGAFSIAWQMGRGGNSPSFFLLTICGSLLLAATVLMLVIPALLFGAPLLMCLIGAAYELMAAPIMADRTDLRRLTSR